MSGPSSRFPLARSADQPDDVRERLDVAQLGALVRQHRGAQSLRQAAAEPCQLQHLVARGGRRAARPRLVHRNLRLDWCSTEPVLHADRRTQRSTTPGIAAASRARASARERFLRRLGLLLVQRLGHVGRLAGLVCGRLGAGLGGRKIALLELLAGTRQGFRRFGVGRLGVGRGVDRLGGLDRQLGVLDPVGGPCPLLLGGQLRGGLLQLAQQSELFVDAGQIFVEPGPLVGQQLALGVGPGDAFARLFLVADRHHLLELDQAQQRGVARFVQVVARATARATGPAAGPRR